MHHSVRERLPNRRAAELLDFEQGGRRWTATVGRFAGPLGMALALAEAREVRQ
jgi:hypothetical protein